MNLLGIGLWTLTALAPPPTGGLTGSKLAFDRDGEPVVLVGGDIRTGVGTRIAGGIIEIRGSRITRVAPAGAPIPAGARRIDLAGKIVTPGLIAVDSAMGLVEIEAEISTHDDSASEGDSVRAAFDAATAVNADSALLPVNAMEGITSAAVTPQGGLISGQVAWIDLVAGDHRDIVAGRGVAMRAHLGAVVGSRALALAQLREVFDDAVFFRRNRGAYDRNQSRALGAHRLDLEALAPVVDGRMPLVVSADRASDLLALAELAASSKLRVVAIGGAQAWKVAASLARADVTVVVQPSQNLPSSLDEMGARLDNAALLVQAGVHVGIAVLGDAHNARNVTQEAGIAVANGMPADAALAALTSELARAYGVDAHYGSISAGKVANLVVWDGDPFELSQRPSQVWIRGRSIALRSRQTELRDRYLRRIGKRPRSGLRP